MRWRASRGQMMAIFALTLGVFIGALALGVDLSRLRTEAERVQHAANAAALAGVVFLPDYQSNAFYRAREEAGKNSFHDGQNGVTVTPIVDPGYSTRLKVTITEPSPLIFGKALGLGPQTISRSAIAEYAQPLQMGAPDYVLGYPLFPTNLVTQTAGITPTGQGFYLEARGPYGQQENGDAYSQYYESYSGAGFNGNSTDTNPCPSTSGTVGGCANLTPNPDVARIGEGGSGFTGYDYVVDNPITQTLVIKIFDPYDEGAYNQDDTSTKACCKAPSKYGLFAPYGVKFPDQWGCTVGGTQFCVSATSANTPTTVATQFTLSGPYDTIDDSTPRTIALTPTLGTTPGTTNTGACAADCVLSNPFIAGDDPIHTLCQGKATAALQQSCYDANPSPYAFKFLNYAIIHAKGLYHIHVQTVANTSTLYAGRYGTGGNIFALAACAGASPVLGSPNLPAADGDVATADPYTAAGPTIGWNQASCPDPNTGISGCSHPGTAPVDQCVHIFAVSRMCLYNNLAPGNGSHAYAMVPLGYVPTDYAGQTLHVRLYDVGDISGSNTNGVEVLTPAGDTTHYDSMLNAGFPASLPYTWSVAPTDSASGYKSVPTTKAPTPGEVTGLSGGTGKYNGAWLDIDTTIPANSGSTAYTAMVSRFGGYWKMLYDINIGDSGNDTTTWEISVSGSPVHLVTN